MFRIESYITPIILNHVAKYVKNIRPQDAQVSLWEGEVSFQNLDLRLDILEEELQLPFEFLSGHIHELSIHVPWTKIASEPITITINTIEFVLKLKDSNSDVAASRPERRKKLSKIEENQAGYMPGLVNKVANNITVNCHNIILKYVEEDIVVSMNVQLLSFSSADENWKPSFNDINPTKIILRKLVQVSDLTICLDKRNSAGQIDVCQEPILYRCTLEMRIIRKYNAATATKKSTTRVDVFTKAMDINVSSQQFPMAMRLIILLLALKDGKLKIKNEGDALSDSNQDVEQYNKASESYISWAWNLLPTIFPEDSFFDEAESGDGHIINTGLYIEKLKFTLKSAEMFADSIVQSTRKIRYNPILKICLNGIYTETFIAGKRWFNTLAGVCDITVEPLGSFATTNSVSANSILYTEIRNSSTAFMENSLFDTSATQTVGDIKQFATDWEVHLSNVNEDYLRYRGPALAFDMVHLTEIPDDLSLGSELGSDFEYSNFSEKLLTRLFISTMTIKYNSTFLNIIDTVQCLLNTYDYPPYVEEKIEPTTVKMSPPSMDDYDALMSDIPRKIYQITIINCAVEIHPKIEPIQTSLRTNDNPKKLAITQQRKQIPYFKLEATQLELSYVAPIYCKRLVHTTCQLPDKPKKLLDACYSTLTFNIQSVLLYVADEMGKLPFCSIPTGNITYGSLLQPNVWTDESIVKSKIQCNIENILFVFNRPQQMIALKTFYSYQSYRPDLLTEAINSSAKRDMHSSNLPKIEFEMKGLRFSTLMFERTTICKGSLKSVYAHTFLSKVLTDANQRSGEKYMIIIAPSDQSSSQYVENYFCQWSTQLPKDYTNIIDPPFIVIKIDPSVFVIHSILAVFHSYNEEELEIDYRDETPPQTNTSTHYESENKSSKISHLSEKDRQSKKVTQPEETIHLSSDKADKLDSLPKEVVKEGSTNPTFLEFLPVLKTLIVNIDISQCTILIPFMTENQHCKNINRADCTLLRLPVIKCTSSPPQDIEISKSEHPLMFGKNIWTKNKDTFPWTCSLSELSLSTKISQTELEFLAPSKTNITVAITSKKEDSECGVLGINLHIDTSPIVMYISEEQLIFLKETLNSFMDILEHLYPMNYVKDTAPLQQPRIVTTVEDDLNIKEFLGISSNSEISSEVAKISTDERKCLAITTWLQWTVTKLTIHLQGSSELKKHRLSIEFEDFITSIDRQEVYFKLKSKIGTLNAQCFEYDQNEEWTPNDSLKLSVRTETSEAKNDTFFDVTITIAETGSVFEKWGAQKKIQNLNQSLTEVMITAQAIDLRLDLKLFSEFVPIFYVFGSSEKSEETKSVTAVSDLPLLYFESKGVVLYMPIDTGKEWCNVLIFKIGKIKISPGVENPLSRNPVRPDVFTKAAQLRILNTPGSKVEDRQYELLFSDMSALTGNWDEILAYMKDNSGNFQNTNPAFEWNHQSKKSSIVFNQIFSKFVISVIYAPCIVYKMVLISGQSIEINCVTDFVSDITTDQIILLNSMYEILENMNSSTKQLHSQLRRRKQSSSTDNSSLSSCIKHNKRKRCTSDISTPGPLYGSSVQAHKSNRIEKITTIPNHQAISKLPSEKIFTDSGIASLDKNQSITHTKHEPNKRKETIFPSSHNLCGVRHIPYEISFVAGIFSFKLYHTYRRKKRRTDSEPDDIPLPMALIAITITQPSMLITQKIFEQSMKFSLFNLNINFGWSKEDENKMSDFGDIFFETRQGHLDSAGIPPPLIFIMFKETISRKNEIDCMIRRPIKIFLSHKTIEKFLTIRILLNEIFIAQIRRSKYIVRPVVRGTKIKIIKQLLFNADLIRVSLEQTNFECRRPQQYDLKVSIGKFIVNFDLCDRPEKLKFDITLISFLLSTERRIMLHPVTLYLNGEIVQEAWNRYPIIMCNIRSDVIQIDIGPENLKNLICLNKSIETIWDSFLKQWEHLEEDIIKAASTSTDVVFSSSMSIVVLPPVIVKNVRHQNEELYQDDLRAGAFQFIETNQDISLPLPYQIQIILKDNGIVCWRYPQPRSIRKLQIYPVPLQTTSPIHIKCRLEYFSEPHSTFLPYCEFELSETETNLIDLPAIIITANVWRVVILQSLITVESQYFEESISSDEDDLHGINLQKIKIEDILKTNKSENDFKLHPKALVGCMRIDTLFNPKYIPLVQGVMNVTLIKINLQNQHKTKKYHLLEQLKYLKLAGETSHTQTFMSFALSNIKLHGNLLSFQKYSIGADLSVCCKILDYSYLNMLYLVEDTTINSFIDIKDGIIINFVADTLRVNISPAIMQTLSVSYKFWLQNLRDSTDEELIIMTRFVICNCTNVSLQFGQASSNELILLKSNECYLYSFRSDKLEQKLVFLFESLPASDPVLIANEGLQYIRIENSILLIKTEKLSATQLCVYLKGQIEFLSMTREEFRLQCRPNSIINNAENSKPSSSSTQIMLNKYGRVSYFGDCLKDGGLCLRLKLNADKRKGWSGEVPLKRTSKNIPWLVKVPVSSSQEYISFWIRIVLEDIKEFSTKDFKPQRVLVVIWPMFVLRSMFSSAIKANDSKSGVEYTIKGKGELQELGIAGTHETEHEIIFQKDIFSSSSENENENRTVLSYKNVDWNKFFWCEYKYLKIENVLDVLTKNLPLKGIAHTETYDYDNNHSKTPIMNPIFRCLPSRELSCSLMLEILPSCYFINALGIPINISNLSGQQVTVIDSNKKATPNLSLDGFTIAIKIDSKWTQSSPILIEDLTKKSIKKDYILIPEVGRAVITIFHSAQISKFLLNSSIDDGLRIFTLTSLYVITNFSSFSLNVSAFVIGNDEKIDMRAVDANITASGQYILPNTPTAEISSGLNGIAIDSFCDLYANRYERTASTAHYFFACIKFKDNSKSSCPISFNSVFNRKCFSIYNDNTAISFAACLIENEGQYFLNIYDDKCPYVEFYNQTDLLLFLAQTDLTKKKSKETNVISECDEKYLEWYQMLYPRSQLSYTPPGLYLTFPDIECQNIELRLGLVNDSQIFSKENIRLSKPLEIDGNKEQFLNIPLQGDIKVIVCDKHKTIKILLVYVAQQMEFSVKDLRTRLKHPSSSDSLSNMQFTSSDHTKENNANINTASGHLAEVYSCTQCDTRKKNISPIKINIFAKEINLNAIIYSKQKTCLNTGIISFYLDDFVCQYDNQEQILELILSNMQVDNQLNTTGNYDFPVVLGPQIPYENITDLPSPTAIDTILQTYKNHRPLGQIKIHYYEHTFEMESVYCKLNPMRAYIEDTYLTDLMDFWTDYLIENVAHTYSSSEKTHRTRLTQGMCCIPIDVVIQALYLSEPLKLNSIHIEPMSMLLSFHTCVRFYIALDHSPLDFSSYERKKIITLPDRFGHTVGMHYISGALFGAGWVVGSLEILGSPCGLARSLTTGLRDFVSMPMQGLLRGPWGFIVGITQGSASLLKNITAGTVNSVTKLASSVSRNLDRLTLDEEHFQRTEILRRSRPQGFTEGFAQGLTGLGISLLGAVGGLARHPLEARSAVGIVTGVGKGIVGAFAKPISGAAELVALSGQGVLHTVGFNTMPKPRNPMQSKNMAIYPAECKLLWKLLPSVLSTEQILFYYEATLISGDILKRVLICLTPTIFAILELEKDELSEIIPIERIEASLDDRDNTLINIKVLSTDDANEESESQFIKARILSFLRDSSDHLSQYVSNNVLDKRLHCESSNKYELFWSFYISKHLGRHLLRYITLVKGCSNKVTQSKQ